jgi:glutathione S-transferase
MTRIFYMPRTRSTRVLWALEEIGGPYDATRLAPEERSTPEHRARHPLGRVPALELDDGSVMFESAAICLQLADLHPDAGLMPPVGSTGRAFAYQWTLFGMTELEAPLYAWLRAQRDGASGEAHRERFTDAATALAEALGERQWLLGDELCVADIVCVGVLGSAHTRGLLQDWPALQAYVERGEARPAHQAALRVGVDAA